MVGKSGLVVASQTPLGWVRGQHEGESTDRHCMFVTTDPPEDLNDMVQQYIERESFGLGRDDVNFDSDENTRVRRTMEAIYPLSRRQLRDSLAVEGAARRTSKY